MEGLGVAANVIAVVELSVNVIRQCAQYAQDVKHAKDDKARLSQEATHLHLALKNADSLLNSPQGARLKGSRVLFVATGNSEAQLRRLDELLASGQTTKSGRKASLDAMTWPFQCKEVETLIHGLRRCTEAISSALQVDQTAIILDIDQKTALDRLPVAEGASYDSRAEEHSPTCLQNTRVDLLRQIQEWANDPNAKAIFWLNGMAGTGKSTISRTVAQSFASSGRLGASFFFKRGEADRGSLAKFFTTLAVQLAEREPAIAPHIKAAIDADPNIAGKAVREQFERLIIQPLGNTPQDARRLVPLVVIVDALDECDRDEDVKFLINLFSCTTDLQFPKLRILITSRPELPIRLGFHAVKGTYQDLILHEIPSGIIEHDISAFFNHELTKIKTEYNSSVSKDRHLPLDWPGEENVQLLVKMAVPLFIFATTICRFLSDRRFGNPNKQLTEVLQLQSESQISQLSATYLPVLNRLIDGLENWQRDNLIERFRHIVGSIVVLGNPLPISALGRLLNIQKEMIDDQLDLLHSVLSIPLSEQSPVRMLHLSFRDFLVDPKKCGEHLFWVDEKQVHDQLLMHCLDVMNKYLEMDICKLIQPGTDRASISPQDINSSILPEVQYACLYWVHHIQQANMCVDDNGPVYEFLLQHFLHWLEVLSLIGRASESLTIIKDLQAVHKLEGSEIIVDFLQDAQRFILTNISTIDATPLQIYSSVLAFTPKNSAIRNAFFQDHQIPKWISLAPEPEDNWDQCQQILEGHTDSVFSVAFSHDSTFVASASYDKTIRLWRVDDGTCIQELKGHMNWVASIAFSHDSTFVASASYDKTIRLWRVDDGTCIQELKGHMSRVMSVAFSHDSTFVASASYDKTIWLWRVDDGTCMQELKGHTNWVTSVAFSHDSTLVASASYDKTIRLWRVDDGTCMQELKGHTNWVTSVAFSHDSTFVASASGDKTTRLWCTDDGTCMQELKGHTNWVTSVAFSHDSTLVASASNDQMIRLWRTEDGTYIQKLKGHTDSVFSVAFSHDSTLVASASGDKTIRLWRVEDSTCMQKPKGHTSLVFSVAFSHDSTLVASASGDQTIRLWRTEDGTCIQKLKGHTDSVFSVAFSHDSTLVASASRDETIRLWRTEDGTCMQELKGHTNWVASVAFSHDSTLVASASRDKTIRLWRIDDGTCIQKITGIFTSRLQFDPKSSCLLTDAGAISIKSPVLSPENITIPFTNYLSGVGISGDRCWIMWQKKQLLWLPVSFRPHCSEVSGLSVVIGCKSGKVIIMRFANLPLLN
ncbi:vegetative incompatibility protein HET-E-1 [Ilyonectria robusta]